MNVLLATDTSQQAAPAERLVASTAWPDPTRIVVLYVDQAMPSELELPAAKYASLQEQVRQRIDAHLTRVQRAIDGPGRQVETSLLPGRAATVIVEEARRITADVVVVGGHGYGAIASALLGSVSAEVVDQAPCPVLVARKTTLAKVVLATDGSAGAREAEDVVAEWPFLAALPVRVVSVASMLPSFALLDPVGPRTISADTYQQLSDELRAGPERAANESVKRLVARHVNAVAVLRVGYAPNEIVRDAANDGADLIVIGSRGHTGLTRLLLGSVARSVLHQAPCSVLVARRRSA